MKLPDLQPDVIRSVDNSTLDEGMSRRIIFSIHSRQVQTIRQDTSFKKRS